MKKLILISTILFFGINVEAQSFGDILSAGLDGILQTENINRKVNHDQQVLMSVVSNLFKKTSSKEHDLNVANARSPSVTIDGMNSQMAALNGGVLSRDLEGNVYFTLNGITTKLNQSVVSRAEVLVNGPTIENASLQNYNLLELENEYNFEKKEKSDEKRSMERYYLNNTNESLGFIASKFKVNVDDIYFQPYKINKGKLYLNNEKYSVQQFYNSVSMNSTKNRLQKVYSSKNYLFKSDYGCGEFFSNGWESLTYNFDFSDRNKVADGYIIYVNKKIISTDYYYNFDIPTVFSCNWAKDFDGNGYGFKDFHGIKRSFFKRDNILFIGGYTSDKEGTWNLEVFDNSKGTIVYKNTGKAIKGAQIITCVMSVEKLPLPLGSYIYNFTLTSDDNVKVSKSEAFEIIED